MKFLENKIKNIRNRPDLKIDINIWDLVQTQAVEHTYFSTSNILDPLWDKINKRTPL